MGVHKDLNCPFGGPARCTAGPGPHTCLYIYDFPDPLERPVGWVLSFHFRANRDPAVPMCVTGCVKWLYVRVATRISGRVFAHSGVEGWLLILWPDRTAEL